MKIKILFFIIIFYVYDTSCMGLGPFANPDFLIDPMEMEYMHDLQEINKQKDIQKKIEIKEKILKIIETHQNLNQSLEIDSFKDILINFSISLNDNLEIFKLLIFNGANINELSQNFYTPLNTAIREKNYEAVKILLENNADPNLEDKVCDTPLMVAIKNLNSRIIFITENDKLINLNIIKLLLYYGANPYLKNLYEDSAFNKAKDENLENIVTLFENSKKNLVNKLTKLLSKGYLNLNNKKIILPKDIAQLIAQFRYN